DGDGDGKPTLGEYHVVITTENADPSSLVDRAPVARLNAILAVSGRGVPLSDDAQARVSLNVAPSEVGGLGGLTIEDGKLLATTEGTRWQIATAALRVGAAALALTGHGDGPQADIDLNATLKGRLPGPRDRVPDLRGDGALAVHVAGTLPDAAVTVRGHVAELRVGAVRVGAAQLRAHVEKPLSAPAGQVDLRARALSLSAQAPRVDRLVLTASGDRSGLRVDAAVAGPRVHGGLRARGALTAGAADVRLEALSLDFATARYRQTLALEHPARLQFRAGDAVRWEGLALAGTGFRFTGHVATDGLYRLPPNRHEPLADVHLALRKASVNGLTPLDAELDGTLSRRRATARVHAAMPSAHAEVNIDADLPVVVPAHGSPRLAQRGDVRLAVRSNEVHLEAVPLFEKFMRQQGVSGGVATLNAAVTGDVAHPDAKVAFDLRDVMYRNIRGHGRDSTLKTVPGLGGSLTIETAPGAIHAGAVLRIHKAGVLIVDAKTPLDLRALRSGIDLRKAPVQATVTIPAFALASLSEFTDDVKGLSGQLSGQGTITGTLARPSGAADLRITDAKVDDLTFRQVVIHGDASDGHVDAQLTVEESAGGTLTGSASVERKQNDRVQASLQGRDLDLRFVRLFAPTVREVAGVAQLTASAAGTLQAPQVTAALSIEKGRLGLIGQPTFHDIRVAAGLKPGRGDLTRLEARSGAGWLSGSGWVSLDGLTPRRAVFKASAHRFLVAAAGSTGALIDGDLAVEAALQRDVVSGLVQVPRAQVWLPKGPSTGGSRNLQKIGPHDDVRFIDGAALAAEERQREAAAAAKPKAVNVTVRTGQIFVRGKDLDIELDSTLKVGTVASGPRAGQPTISGGIFVRHGRINIQGQRFDFDRGDISFDGSPDVNPRLDILLEHQYPDARVLVQLTGTPKKPHLRLTSDPPIYDQAQIVSLVLTGQPGGQPSNGKSFDPTAAVTTAVLSKLADKLAPEVGLDVLRVENVEQRNEEGAATGDANTRIEVGKYISDRIYLSYAHVFGATETANQNEAHVEYRLTRRWMLETIFGDAGVGGVDALWTLRY
ncbi:MAG: translocation and assembly module TamB, partial [Myxococcales bacterium]|nr:translocation and assembly module TamB [Myxococcales bacterium]